MPDDKLKEKGKRSPRTEHDIDKGFAWIVLLGSFFIEMLTLGSLKSYGVLYTEMVDYFSSGSGNTAFIGSIAWFLLQALGPVTNLLSKKFTFRRVSIVGGILLGFGYFLSGFVTRMELMYLTFTLCGIGYGLSAIAGATIVSFYFKKRRALANGIVMSASGIGAVFFPFLYRFLIEKYGLLRAMWIIGAFISNVCVAGSFFRQPACLMKTLEQKSAGKCTKSEAHKTRSDDITASKESQKETRQSCCRKLDLRFSLFKNRMFSMYVIAFMFSSFGLINNTILIPSHVKELGYDERHVALSVSIAGGAEVFARIFVGWFADLKLVRTKYIFVACMFIGGIFSLIAPLFDSFTYMAIYAASQFTFPGSFLSLISVLVIEAVGMDDFSEAFGLIFLCLAFISLINQPICGWMYDYFGSWHSSIILTGTSFICAGVTVLLEPVITRCCTKQMNIVSDNNLEMTAPEGQSVKELKTKTGDSSLLVGDNISLPAFRNDENETYVISSDRMGNQLDNTC